MDHHQEPQSQPHPHPPQDTVAGGATAVAPDPAPTIVDVAASDPLDQDAAEEIQFHVSQVIERLEAGTAGSLPIAETVGMRGGFLNDEKVNIARVVSQLENLMIGADEDDDVPQMRCGTDAGKVAAISAGMAALAAGLPRSRLHRVSAALSTDTTRWLSHLFRFIDCNACFHHDQLEGLVKVTRLMLHYKYPRYFEEGGSVLVNQLPCIYSSTVSPLGVVQHLCRQLGLPLACIRPVPVNTVFGSNQTMNVSALQHLMAEDMQAKRIPLIVLADAGTTIAGHSDNISRLHDLCRLHDCWLHLRGHTLAALAITQSNMTIPPRIADSVTIPIGIWLGIPCLPSVTLYRLIDSGTGNRGREVALPLLAGLTSDNSAKQLTLLPLWAALKASGKDAIVSRITAAFYTCSLVWTEISKIACLRLLSKQPGGEGGAYSIEELTTKPLNTATIFEVAISSVVFQFVPVVPEGTLLGKVPSYYDKLNSWLGQILQRDADQIPIEICESESYGVVLRYCPLESLADSWLIDSKEIMMEKLEAFSLCLEQQVDILVATVSHKETFNKLVEESSTLRLVEMPGWAGLGGVRYVPEGWEAIMTEQTKEELNNINMSLVENLRATDTAFSLGEGNDGMACVRFGMVTADTDVEELLNLMISVGKDFEENSKVLESMTEIVKKGIEAATMDLQKESTDRLWQEGILRHVPVVGRVVDWWSPPPAVGIKGRSLNLRQGTIESTENIYKYHMQIPSGTKPHGVSKAPPPAMVQTLIGEGIDLPESMDSTHSRNSSHSSTATSASQSVPSPADEKKKSVGSEDKL